MVIWTRSMVRQRLATDVLRNEDYVGFKKTSCVSRLLTQGHDPLELFWGILGIRKGVED